MNFFFLANSFDKFEFWVAKSKFIPDKKLNQRTNYRNTSQKQTIWMQFINTESSSLNIILIFLVKSHFAVNPHDDTQSLTLLEGHSWKTTQVVKFSGQQALWHKRRTNCNSTPREVSNYKKIVRRMCGFLRTDVFIFTSQFRVCTEHLVKKMGHRVFSWLSENISICLKSITPIIEKYFTSALASNNCVPLSPVFDTNVNNAVPIIGAKLCPGFVSIAALP